MRILYAIMAIAMVWSVAQGQVWTNIATDPSGDSGGLDATALDYYYDASSDVVLFRITTTNLASYSTGPAADFSFQLPNGLAGGQVAGSHWTAPGTPVHKTGYVYADPGGTAPISYTYNTWPQVIEVTSDQSVLCSNCISLVTNVGTNELIYTIDRQDIITNTEMGGASATILVVANAGHDVMWDDNITMGAPMTIDVATSMAEEGSSDSPSIYPNPAKDRIMISYAPSAQISGAELIDLTGKKVATFSSTLNNVLTLDVSSHPAGLYFISSQFDGQAPLIRKVMIQ